MGKRVDGVITFRWWVKVPLYARILTAVALGGLAGFVFGPAMADWGKPARLIVDLIKVLAMPLILFAILQVVMTARAEQGKGGRLAWLLTLNTIVAISIGLLLANLWKPGLHADRTAAVVSEGAGQTSLLALAEDSIPKSVLGPLTDAGTGKALTVIIVAIAFGLALRRHRGHPAFQIVDSLVSLGLKTLVTMLHWVVELLPLAVFGIIASKVGTNDTKEFVRLAHFVGCVCAGLFLQSCWYVVRIWSKSWVSPMEMFRTCGDALLTAFSTASSTAAMPITYERLRERLGVREDSANLGALVGTNFNNDGTALYEAVAALFVAQLVDANLTLGQQLIVVFTSMLAAMGAAGIPEGGAATLALVLGAVHLPTEYVALLLTVDWFVDRCRTMVNVMGDISVACLLDGRVKAASDIVETSKEHPP